MSYVLIVPDFRCVLPNLTNQNLLELSTTLFLLFVIAEIIGAWSSNSLSLLGDASSMGVDVSTYICNIYGEWAKAHSQRSTVTSRIVLEVAIPALSTIAMVAVTLYVLIDAVRVLRHPSITNDVNTNYLYGYAAANLIVDAICGYLFSLRVDDVFVETNQVPQLSLDTFVALDQDEEDFGHLEDDLDGFMNSSDTSAASWNLFNTARSNGYAPVSTSTSPRPSGSNSSGNSSRSAADGGPGSCAYCCSSGLRIWQIYFTSLCCGCCSCGSGSGSGGGADTSAAPRTPGSPAITTGTTTGGQGKKNLNMVSAFTHILGDTMRTVAMLLAALVSTVTGIDGDICDAWAALVVSLTIIALCLSLVLDVTAAAWAIYAEEYGEGASPGGGRLSGHSSSSGRSRGRGAAGGSYRRVNDIDCDDLGDDCVEV